MKPSRYPQFQKDASGKKLCRGCGKLVPKGRKTWCSTLCYNTYCPREVNAAVRQRDKDTCQICRKTFIELLQEWQNARIPDWKGIFSGQSYPEYQLALTVWKKEHPFPHREFDHIIPFSEGGKTVLENMRLLCSSCHKKRTAQWRKEKARKL